MILNLIISQFDRHAGGLVHSPVWVLAGSWQHRMYQDWARDGYASLAYTFPRGES